MDLESAINVYTYTLRVTPKEDLHSSSGELMYGEPLMIPSEFIPSNTTP